VAGVNSFRMNQNGQNLAPQGWHQLSAVAEVRWRIFVNSLHSIRGRLELVSRVFAGTAFLAGGLGGAIGLGGTAWFLLSEGNPEWLGALLWPVFLFWQLFPLMATVFTKNHESANLLRFPLSYRAYFLIRLAYGSLDPATTVASLWLLGIHRHWSRPTAPAALGSTRPLHLRDGEPAAGANRFLVA